MRLRGMAFCMVMSVVCGACVTPAPPSGRVSELRGRIVQIEDEQGLIAISAKRDSGYQWLKIAPFTSVRGPDIKKIDALQAGQRVYVRYLSNPRTDPPEVLSITVIKYRLAPEGTGIGSFKIPGF